jgi:hypothetical protein
VESEAALTARSHAPLLTEKSEDDVHVVVPDMAPLALALRSLDPAVVQRGLNDIVALNFRTPDAVIAFASADCLLPVLRLLQRPATPTGPATPGGASMPQEKVYTSHLLAMQALAHISNMPGKGQELLVSEMEHLLIVVAQLSHSFWPVVEVALRILSTLAMYTFAIAGLCSSGHKDKMNILFSLLLLHKNENVSSRAARLLMLLSRNYSARHSLSSGGMGELVEHIRDPQLPPLRKARALDTLVVLASNNPTAQVGLCEDGLVALLFQLLLHADERVVRAALKAISEMCQVRNTPVFNRFQTHTLETISVSKLFPNDFQTISKRFPNYFQTISKLFPNYFQTISKLFPNYFQTISKPFPNYLVRPCIAL